MLLACTQEPPGSDGRLPAAPVWDFHEGKYSQGAELQAVCLGIPFPERESGKTGNSIPVQGLLSTLWLDGQGLEHNWKIGGKGNWGKVYGWNSLDG